MGAKELSQQIKAEHLSLVPMDSCDRRQELTPASCSLTHRHTLITTHMYTHTLNSNKQKKTLILYMYLLWLCEATVINLYSVNCYNLVFKF